MNDETQPDMPGAVPTPGQSEWPEDQPTVESDASTPEEAAAVESGEPVVLVSDDDAGYSHSDAPEPAPAEVDVPADVPTTDAPAVDPQTGQSKPKANLKAEVFSVLSDFVTGAITLPEGKSLTVQEIAKQVKEKRGAYGEKPSSGAVASLLKRWDRYGLVTLTQGPTAFVDFTEAARTDGVPATQAKYREQQKAQRAAAREAAAALATTVSPSPTPAPVDASDAASDAPAEATAVPTADAPEVQVPDVDSVAMSDTAPGEGSTES